MGTNTEAGSTESTAAYEAMFRTDYDTHFTTNISNQMQMPDRLGAVSNRLDTLYAGEQHSLTTSVNAHGIDPTYYMVGTPPRVLTAQDALYSDDDDDPHSLSKHYTELNNGLIAKFAPHLNQKSTPTRIKNDRELEQAAVPMTPGTLLVAQSGDEMALVRRQLGKLISHVRRLEDENSRRQQREYILYPLVLGFCLYHFVKLVVNNK